MTLTADDPEGIQKITLEGGFIVECRHPTEPLAQNKSGLYTPSEQILAPDANNMVLTSIFLVRTFEYDTTCQSGFQFRKTTATLNGTGENYFGGITQAGLKIHINP
jgi:hypothetical protein